MTHIDLNQLVCPICPTMGFNTETLIEHLVNAHNIERWWANYLIEELRIQAHWESRLYEARN